MGAFTGEEAVHNNARVLVSNDYSDDAAVVVRKDDQRTLILSADVIAPIVTQPEDLGEIAATNSISDIFAMGGTPLFALNLVFFPDDVLPKEILHRILQGSARACARMGVAVLGGHTVRNADIKFGLSVIGEAKPEQILSNRMASPGESIILSKALGTGIVGTAIKKGIASEKATIAVTQSMTRSNGKALEIARNFNIGACTDVTGFGFLGHLRNILQGSELQAKIKMANLPLLPEAVNYATAGHCPGGSKANLEFLKPKIKIMGSEDPILTFIASDAQTSGGLLFTVETSQSQAFCDALLKEDHAAAIVGTLSNAPTEHVGTMTLDFS